MKALLVFLLVLSPTLAIAGPSCKADLQAQHNRLLAIIATTNHPGITLAQKQLIHQERDAAMDAEHALATGKDCPKALSKAKEQK